MRVDFILRLIDERVKSSRILSRRYIEMIVRVLLPAKLGTLWRKVGPRVSVG